MINNQTHLTELQAPVQTINSRVELYSGSTLVTTCNCHDTLRDFSITRAGSENKYFGFGICQKAQIHLIDIDRTITIDKANTVKVAFGAKGEYIYTVPTFNIDDIQRDETSNDITLVTYDVLYGAANHQVSELGLQMPYTIEAVAQACAAFLGVGFKVVNVSDDSFAASYPTGANLNGTETIRELLDAIAEVTQTIYYINQNDELVFKRLDAHGESVLTIGKSDYYELKAHDAHTLAAITSTTELGENLEATYDGTITGVGATQHIRENPFWTLLEPTDVATKLTAAVAAIGGIVANPYECEWIGNYLLEIGDKLSFIREDGSVITSFLLDDALEYSGIFEEKSNWLFKENEAETPTNPVTVGEKLNQTFARVDKLDKKITLYISGRDEELDSINDRVASLEVTEEAIKGSVETLQTNIDATNGYIETQTTQLRSEMTQTAEGLSLDIHKIKEEGTTKVATTTGYTFDENGLTISKSTSDISTTITENGMTVSNSTTELLTANSEGVSATDLHARTYLIIGDRSRFENYGTSRTGCFWIGD